MIACGMRRLLFCNVFGCVVAGRSQAGLPWVAPVLETAHYITNLGKLLKKLFAS